MMTGSFMAVNVMHSVAVKWRAMFYRVFAPCRQMPVVAMAVVEVMIDVPVEMFWSVEPRSRSDE
jgi:hypothetical protein